MFKFTNVGDKPLVIKRAQASCGCTVPTVTKKPVAPGETGEIAVSYNTNRPNSFSKTITVYSNAKSGERKVLRIKGYVMKKEEKKKEEVKK